MTTCEESRLLGGLVALPSVSGDEGAVAARVAADANGWGLSVDHDDAGVAIEIRAPEPGPTLAFISHLDVVPPGEGWTRDPWEPRIESGRLYGRGSGDAKASVAAMLLAARDLAAAGGVARGRLLVLLGLGEETGDATIPELVARAAPVEAAVVGEPTGLDLAVAQRGLLRLDLVAEGEQRHAAHAGNGAVNAIGVLARDLLALEGVARDREHPLLGHPRVTPTTLVAGVGRNVTPPVARATLDVRSTPAWSHAELTELVRDRVRSRVEVVSDRLVPCETPAGSPLLAIARAILPRARVFGSPTCSDWVFVRDEDALKCGPGESRLSHAPDESVRLEDVVRARRFYAALAGAFLAAP